jgi:hypothetical protein
MKIAHPPPPNTGAVEDRISGHQLLLRFPAKFVLPSLDVTKGVPWQSFNAHPASLQWWMNSFAFLRHVDSSDCLHPLAIKLFLVNDWHHSNCSLPAESGAAWDGHAAALRCRALSQLLIRFPATTWIRDCAQAHAGFLAAAANYQGAWNHGLDQAMGLLVLAGALGSSSQMSIAQARALDCMMQMIDDDGVTREQSVNYQKYNYYQLCKFIPVLRKHGCKMPASILDRLVKMPHFLRHATRPDGTYEEIGDTIKQEADALRSLRDVTTLEIQIKPPTSETCYIAKKAGYIFGRRPQKQTSFSSDDTFYSIRFGPGRRYHGHNDHTSLTYHPCGRPLLVDSGVNAFTTQNWKDYYRSPEAHNVVCCEDKRYIAASETYLRSARTLYNCDFFDFSDRPYKAIKRRRRILFVFDPAALLVVDNIEALDKTSGCQQLWHFAPDITAAPLRDCVDLHSSGFSARMFQLLPFSSISLIKGQSDPLQGWTATGFYERTPNITLRTHTTHAQKMAFITVFLIGPQAMDSSASFERCRGPELRWKIHLATKHQSLLKLAMCRDGTIRLI